MTTNTDGTGTAGKIPRWVDFDSLGDSVMSQSGTFINVGPVTGTSALNLNVDTDTYTNGGLRVTRTALTSVPYLDLRLNTTGTAFATLQAGDNNSWRSLNLNPSGGFVGVGTTAPLHPLGVYGVPTMHGAAREVLSVVDTTVMAANVGAGIALGGRYSSSGGIAQQFAGLQGFKENGTDGDYAGALSFTTRANGGLPTERMRISSAGNVGIGITAPTAKLHVGGDIIATGSITGATVLGATYQDVAEWVPATQDLAPGTVVVINPQRNNEVMASTKPYDTTVAGVVSAQPGLILGNPAATKEQVATTGRVRVHVDATKAPIAIGDLLVTSDLPGVAMKSIPVDVAGISLHRPGTIVGKALEPLAGGVGEILVLLSLQ